MVPSSNKGVSGKLRTLPIDVLQPGKYQPRRDFEPQALEELAESIKTQGIIQPIMVRPIANNSYEIIAGERRWRASQLAGLGEIPVVIRELGDEDTIAISLIENIQREDLNSMEEARALQRLLDEFSMTHQQVADSVGKSRSTVTNLLRLHSLHEDVKLMLENGDLEVGHARPLLSLTHNEQSKIAKTIVAKDLSVRETEKLIKKQQNPTEATTKHTVDPDITRLEDNLSRKLGAKVAIQHTHKGKGKLVIQYNSIDELDGILSHIS